MKLSDLQVKDIVNMSDGRKVGRIIDAEISNEGKINYLIIEDRRGLRNFISKDNTISITFTQIKKIGSDVILVDL
jgi:YlmC/YmxH family sporulation protein